MDSFDSASHKRFLDLRSSMSHFELMCSSFLLGLCRVTFLHPSSSYAPSPATTIIIEPSLPGLSWVVSYSPQCFFPRSKLLHVLILFLQPQRREFPDNHPFRSDKNAVFLRAGKISFLVACILRRSISAYRIPRTFVEVRTFSVTPTT